MQYTFDYKKEGIPGKIEKFILMSKSPRRKELLKDFNPIVSIVDIDEELIQEKYMEVFKNEDFLTRAGRTCSEIARAKSGNEEEEGAVYISSDTMVLCGDKIYNKPKNKTQAEDMLRSYFGIEHYVITSVCLRTKAYLDLFYCLAKIKFVDYYEGLDSLIRDYVDSGKAMDKAGAYGIQEISPLFIEYIEGDINTIIGLPVSEIGKRLFSTDKNSLS